MGGGESTTRCSKILDSLWVSKVLWLPSDMVARVPASIFDQDVKH
jgi:hypothetical protein